jgi:hypothetical protein
MKEINLMTTPSRRQFLQTCGAAGAAMLAPGLVWSEEMTENHTEAPRFRFVQINDTHVHDGEPAYALGNEKMRWLVEALNSGEHFPRPDFVVGVGDLINGEGLERLAPDFRVLREMLAPLRCPLYPVMGNHEVTQQEGNPTYERPYRDAFGEDRVNYTFEQGSLLFIMLNNSGACSVSEAVTHARNEWLRATLESTPEQPKILCCHIPLVVVREEPVLKESFGFRSYTARDAELLGLVDAHADTILAVLSGHLHLTGVATRQGVAHISIAGTASYPCDYALYTVFADRIEGEVRQLPPELVTPVTNIHGRPRYQRDFTDAGHPTAEEYVCGRPDERRFTIPLRWL